MRRLLPAVLMTVVVACGGSPGAEPTTVTETTTTTTAATTTTTTVAATTTTEAPGLEGEELLACMVGGWTFDAAGFEAEIQAIDDPSELTWSIDAVGGGGDLEIRTDRTFTLSYDELTIRYRELGSTLPDPDIVLVVAGEVSGAFELEGNVFLAGDINDPPLAILRSLSGGGYAELPPIIRGASLRMGTRANHPYYMEKITIDCDQDRLVVNDEVRIDPLTGDGPSTIWLRDRTEP